MALLKFLRRPIPATPSTSGSSVAAAEAVQAARQQARRRLVGAVVLLGVGVLGFPLVFQTQPRPIPVDIPIDIPKREGAPALGVASTTATAPQSVQAAAAASAPASDLKAAARVSGAAATPPTKAVAAAPVEPAPAVREVDVEVLKPSSGAPEKTAKSDQPAAVPAPAAASSIDKLPEKGRFVVQAGSYTDAETVRDVRSKLERLGLKTYTQSVQIEGVARTRVRVGPYASKQEALDVQNKIKAAGVNAALLAL